MSILELDNAAHKAFLDGREVVRATTAFLEVGLIDASFFTEESRERGTMIHAAVPKWHAGVASYFPPHVKPYWDGFLLFIAETDFRIHKVEEPVYDDLPGYEYAGQYDLFGEFPVGSPHWADGYYDLIDTKTGTMPATVVYQTAGYGRRIPVPSMRLRRWALVLPGNGKYQLVPLNLSGDHRRVDVLLQRRHENDFLSIIRTANLRRSLRHGR